MGNNKLIGRHREVRAFRAALQRVADGTPEVIYLCGEVGIGRSRLLNALALEARESGAMPVLICNGEDDTPLGGLRRALESDGPAPLRNAFDNRNPGTDPFAALVDGVAAMMDEGPLWLLFDDLQAADESARSLFEHLYDAVCAGPLSTRPVGLVASVQSGNAAEGLRDWLQRRNRNVRFTHWILEGFTSRDVARWLEARFGTAPEETLVKLLGGACAGNPLLLSELALLLERSERLQVTGGRLRVDPAAAAVGLPDTLATLLAARVQTISPACRRVMTLAAFLGQEFRRDTLAELTRINSADLALILAEAEQLALVDCPDSQTVRFRHTHARQHFYEATEAGDRARSHEEIGRRLIEEAGTQADEHSLAITHHLVRAGPGRNDAALLRFAPKAAEMAMNHHSYFLAGRYFEAAAHAAAGWLDARPQAELFRKAGEAFQQWSDGERSNACLRRAAALYERAPDLAGYANVLQMSLRNHVAFGESPEEAARTAARLAELLAGLPDEAAALRVRVNDVLASYNLALARYDVAERYAQTALGIARQADDPELGFIPVTSLALAQLEQLRPADAKATWLEGLASASTAGATRYQGFHLQRLPLPLYCLGEIEDAAAYNKASYEHNGAIGNTGELCVNMLVDVMIANLRGDFSTAVDTGQEALSVMATTRYRWIAAPLIGALAYALTMREAFDDADSVIRQLARNGVIFDNARPYRSTAARLGDLVTVYRNAGEPVAARADETRRLRAVRLGSVGRLCNQVELAPFLPRPEPPGGVHEVLEYVHRRGVALPLGWCGTLPRSLGISAALGRDWPSANQYFEAAGDLARRMQAPLEAGRVALFRALARMTSPDPDHPSPAADLAAAEDCFAGYDAPALSRLVTAARQIHQHRQRRH